MMGRKETIQELEKLIKSLKNIIDDKNWELAFENTHGRLDIYEQTLKEIIKVAFDDVVQVKILKGDHE
tara:strand:+ start:245 stop:448 length:204 start_codon:yes stop_codon:yes gene_type:complete